MKPLLKTVAAICLLLIVHALPENIEDVKELPQSKEPIVEAEESEPQARVERCTTCGSGNLKSPQALLAELQALPGSEVHTQQSFEGCSSDKGCAGLKLKDGKVIERYGNVDAYNAAAAADINNEFHFHSGFGKNVFEGGLPGNGPFWWMNQDSPFKAGAGSSGNFEKYSKSSSSSFSTSGASGAANGVGAVGALDLAGNPFLNGDLANLGAAQAIGGIKPSNFQSSTFESSSFSASNKGEVDLSKNPFLNGGFKADQAGSGFGFGSGAAGSNFDAASQSFNANAANSQSFGSSYSGGFASGNKVSTGYTGSSPTPFATPVSNINLIQSEKANEFDYEQQQQTQQNFDKVFQSAGSVGIDTSGGDLQQTCATEGYSCVIKSQCNNGVAYLRINPRKQYCNVRTEICCKVEIFQATSQGAVGVGSTLNQGSSYAGQSFASQAGSAFGVQGQSTQTGLGSNVGLGTTGSSFGAKGTYGAQSGTTSSFGSSIGSINRGTVGSTGFGSTIAPSTQKFAATNGFKATGQTNLIETDSISAGSINAGVYRPGAIGSNLKPGIPYLPPVDNAKSDTNIISSTAYPTPTFVTTPRPTVRPITAKPTYLPPPVSSTSAPGYLPPIGEQTINRETIVPPNPTYNEGSLYLDQNRQPVRPTPIPSDIPVGCAAALKCTPIEFCTAEGVISNTTVILTRDQDAYRVPLTDCKDIETGRVGKCCRDPYYTDPWPTNQLGKWVPGVFGGNDGKYVPDSRGSSNNIRPTVTARPPVTGSVILNNFLSTKPPGTPFGSNQVTPGYPTSTATPFVQKGQFGQGGQGQFSVGGQGQYSQGSQGQRGVIGQGQIGSGSQVNTAFSQGQYGQKGQGQIITQGRGQVVKQGQGQFVSQGQGQYSQGAKGQFGVAGQGVQTQFGVGQKDIQGQGIGVIEGQGIAIKKGQGQYSSQGQGQIITQGQGAAVSQGFGTGIRQGQGVIATQGQGQIATQAQGAAVSQGFGTGIRQGQGQITTQGQGAVVSQGFGTGIRQGQGQITTQGQGAVVSQGFGTAVSQGQGQYATQGQGAIVSQGFGEGVRQGQGQYVSQGQGQLVSQGQGQYLSQGQGQLVTRGQGLLVSQGFGQNIRQGQGFSVSQGSGIGVENEYGESVQRVFLQQYNGGGKCGLLNGQKPNGNRNNLEVDFAEIPWQAMVLLQTNKSLLCGGVITRPDVVVTSAACVDGLDAKNVLIKGGEWKLGIDDEPLPFQIVQVKTILRHPFYKSGSAHYDAAILVLTENLRFAKNIYPICLPGADETLDKYYDGAGQCIVTGWGKQVLQAHLSGSIMHSLNVSLITPGECQAKLSSDYPHLLDQYDEDSCVCGQPSNPLNNICKVDIGSALACTTGDGHYVFRGVYSWDSGCQTGNQLAAFYRFDLEWYQWAIGLIESVRFAQFSTVTKVTSGRYSGGVKGFNSAKGSQYSGVKGSINSADSANGFGVAKGQFGFGQGLVSQGQFKQQFSSEKVSSSGSQSGFGTGFNFAEIKPISNGFSATYSEKKVFQSEPKIITYTTKPEIVTYTTKPEIVTYTTKPEIVTFTTKPEIFTYTTKPKIITYTTKPKIVTYTTKPQIITYTTKPQIISYETSGSRTNPQYIAPGVTFNPSFSELVGKHEHTAKCKCLEGKK
ncbi:uncharacterized protein LOC124541826 isoform X2 [Vanessa cardui]|uniref:uncharacterized protein LOC124541826 isoform X2 n=1 Tax=Vanessa cardui TaxID=171605 RepID=UPI001F134F62|nr:uncharacterized protein LOC124541826 isoform X2 [Vanessa cardui]